MRDGFTAVSNAVFEKMVGLSGSELKLMMAIIRLTSGYHRRHCVVGETRLLDLTGLSRTTLYLCKDSLQKQGYLKVLSTCGCSRYALADALQSVETGQEPASQAGSAQAREASLRLVKPAVEPDPREKRDVDPYKKPDGHPSENYDTWKDSERKETQQTAEKADRTFDRLVSSPSPTPGDDVFKSSNRKPASLQDAPLSEMVGKLRALGVQAHVAQQLASSRPEDVIQRALDRVEQLKPRSAAGFVVSELQRGGYGALTGGAVDVEQQLRRKREEIAALRAAERHKEAAEKEQAHQRTLCAQERFEQLSQDQQSLVRQRVQEWAQRENLTWVRGWGETHPMWAGLLAETMKTFPS